MEQLYIDFIAIVLGYLYFRIWMAGKYFSTAHPAEGKTVIITGATSNVGRDAAMGLAKRGAKVILACQDIEKGQSVCSMIKNETKNNNVKVMYLDLASFKSIRTFANTFLNEEPRLDILINNASVMGVPRTLTKDGLEMHIGVNHFGHFLLTNLLIERLKQSTPSRVVTVSNWGHTFVRFNRNDLYCEKSYNRVHAYFHSKLANVLFTAELSNRLSGSGITSNSLHPGFFLVDTSNDTSSSVLRTIFDFVCKIFLRTTESAAQNILFAALDFNYQTITGVYLDNNKIRPVNPDADDPELRSWLWEHSEKVTGIRFPTNIWKTEDQQPIPKIIRP